MEPLVKGTLWSKGPSGQQNLWSKVPSGQKISGQWNSGQNSSGQRDSGQRIQTRSVCEQLKAFMKMRHFVLYYKTEVHRAPNFFSI